MNREYTSILKAYEIFSKIDNRIDHKNYLTYIKYLFHTSIRQQQNTTRNEIKIQRLTVDP